MSPNNQTNSPLHLLLLEDNPADADLVIAELRRAGLLLEVKVVGTKAAYAECLDSSFDAIVSDYDLPQFNAREALVLLQAKKVDIPFIVVSGTMGEETAVDLIKLGAADYLLKDRLARLPQALVHAVQDRVLRLERANVQAALRESEERMRAILESALDAVVTMNHAGEIVELNPASEKIFGLSRCDALGKRLVDLIIPERLRDDHNRGLDLYLKTGEARMLGRRVEVIAQKIDGTEFPAEMAVMRIGSAEPPLFTAFIRDIGEKLRAQKIVRESEERLQRVIANLREGLIISDMQGELLDWNPAALEMHGITSADPCRFRLADCANIFELSTLDGTILPLEEWPLPRIVRGERLHDFEARLRRLGTDWERVLSYGGAIIDDATWGQLAFVTIKDITEQRQTENARREADQHLTDIINSVEGIVWETDEETNRMTFISEKAEEILGYPTARWLAEPGFWRSHMHPDDQEKTISVTGGNGHSQPTELEYRMVSAAGREVWFKDRVSVVKLPGRSVKQRGIMLDITHRKLADREARAGEARIREQAKLLDLAHDAIMVRDMEDRIEFWNHGAEKLYGWTAAEVQGKEASGFLYKDEPAAAAATRASLLENGKWTGECKHVCKDGGHVTVRSRWTLVRDDLGAPKSVLIINTDITEQKRIEEQFLRAQRLESIGTLASGVAHDLNNILAPILMGAAVLRRTEMPAPDEMILSTIETCAQRGADIVKQVLTFARGTEGARLLLQPAHLINDMAKIAEGTFPKTIAVRTEYPQSLWPIEGDPTQLHQILLNLSVNARDAMPAGGALTISARNFPVDEHYASMTPGARAGPHVLFEVKDTGMGIPRQIIDQIFDPFFTTKELGLGTGLGLSTVIGIAKSHGGFVSVESKIGRGTTFKVYLPAMIDAPGGLKKSEAAALPPAKGELLLIVDDEKTILQVAKELLEGHGYQVLTAGDAPEALAIFALRKDEISLVLTDLAMPLMDGIALIRTLQKMKPDVCLIASTGQGSMEQGVHELVGLNVRACLTKPYNKEMLLTTLHDALSPRTHKL